MKRERGSIALLQAILLASTAALTGAVTTVAARDAQGDEQNAQGEEEVIVTARKKSERLMDVPVAVSAVTGGKLARNNAADLTRIADLVPQVAISRTSTGAGGSIAIRGIGSSSGDAGIESAVAVNVDGMLLSRGYITQAGFFDLQQVEVLKGPQALFFGKNSPAGVISLISAGPGDELAGYVRSGYEFTADEVYIEGAVGGPVTDTLGVRVALRYDDMKGYLYNTAQRFLGPLEPYVLPGAAPGSERNPGTTSLVGRVTLDWQPSERFSAVFKLLGSVYTDNDTGGYAQVVQCAPGHNHPSTAGVEDPFADCHPNKFRTAGYFPAEVADHFLELDRTDRPYTESRQWMGTLKLDYDMGPVQLTSVTGGYMLDTEGAANADWTTFDRIAVNGEKSTVFSEELRLATKFDGPLNAVFGAYYEDAKRDVYTVGRGPGSTNPLARVVPDPRNGSTSLFYPYDLLSSKTYSVFGQMVWQVTPEIEVAGGVRYTKESKDVDLSNRFVNAGKAAGAVSGPGAPFLPEGVHLTGDFDDDNWSPEVTLTWRPTSNQTVYAAYRSGYKSGGFSTTAVLLRSNTADQLRFESETAKGFEIGYKARLLDGRMRVSGDVYRYEYGNLQRSSLDIATTSFIIRNAAAALIKGVEFEVSYAATDHLTLTGSISYNHARYLNYPEAPCYNGQTAATGCQPIPGSTAKAQDLSGTRIAGAPDWVLTAGIQYEAPIFDAWILGIAADVKYTSWYFTQADGDFSIRQPGYAKLNASLTFFEEGSPWELSLVGRNLTSEWAVLSSFAKPGGLPGDFAGVTERPREIILSALYRF